MCINIRFFESDGHLNIIGIIDLERIIPVRHTHGTCAQMNKIWDSDSVLIFAEMTFF